MAVTAQPVDLKITVLGCGNSVGVPRIGCDCPVCRSANPLNRRDRCSILVESAHTRLLVDAGPDLRQQCLREGIKSVDAVVFTHAHADHILGVDDLRCINLITQKKLDIYGPPECMDEIKNRFSYLFKEPGPDGFSHAGSLIPHPVPEGGKQTIGDITFSAVRLPHAAIDAYGYRFGNFAYAPDCRAIPAEAESFFAGLDTLMIDCVDVKRPNMHMPTHLYLETTLEALKRLKPRQAVFTNLSHSIDYTELTRELPRGMGLAHDGMVLNVKGW